jgi:hypothetical protein
MERIALEYEQLQEKSIHHDFLTSKNLKRTPSSHSMAADLLSLSSSTQDSFSFFSTASIQHSDINSRRSCTKTAKECVSQTQVAAVSE